jgi:quinol monooxygenase YgiN
MAQTVYVSITGLRVRHFWQQPIFWRHAIASMVQARAVEGCLQAEARTINGIHHTRSVWRDRGAMLAYLRVGAHLNAMKLFQRIATGKTFGFETNEVPDWNTVHRLWHEHGRDV